MSKLLMTNANVATLLHMLVLTRSTRHVHVKYTLEMTKLTSIIHFWDWKGKVKNEGKFCHFKCIFDVDIPK